MTVTSVKGPGQSGDSVCAGYFNQELLILSIETIFRHSFSSPAIQKFIRQ
jgi:hypothetical protein